jgi:hypothetical protein
VPGEVPLLVELAAVLLDDAEGMVLEGMVADEVEASCDAVATAVAVATPEL